VGSTVTYATPLLDPIFAPYEAVSEIGSRPNSLHVVRHAAPGGRPKLLVAERFAGAAKANDIHAAAFVAEARRLSTLASPNVARVRELTVRGDDLIVFWDFIDGDRLSETWLSAGMTLEVALRLILDVLSGVGAIHLLRDVKQQPMKLAHGELSTATVVVGVDGAARVLHAIARRVPGARAEAASLGYLAPEVHAGGAYDARADVFSAGVLLWEALGYSRLFAQGDAAEIVARVRAGIPLAAVPGKAPWARGLVQVAAKALVLSPDDRWPTAAAMAAEIRKAAGLRLAPAMAAAAFAKDAMSERVRARRERLESGQGTLSRVERATAGAAAAPAPLPQSSPAARRWADDDSAVLPGPGREPEGAPVAASVPAPTAAALEAPAEADLELVPESLPPGAPASRMGSALPRPGPHPVDSRIQGAVPVPSPPPLPARALRASPPASVAEPNFAAAIDVPISIAPPPADPFEVAPTSVEQATALAQDLRASRRRRVAVLGGVGAFGLIVFVLAGWRVAHRDGAPPRVDHAAVQAVDAPSALPQRGPNPGGEVGASSSVAAGAPSALSRSAQRPAPAPHAPSAAVPATTASVAVASWHPPRSASPVNPAPALKPSPVAPRKTPAPPPSRPKPRPNAGYDPNSL
jgi:eukaryotic-like serine/threonine-protein kinase